MRLLEVIGRGAHGIVYRALDERLNREVAVKLVRADARPGLVGRFLHEARLLARVRHPNVVTIHGAEVFDDRPGLWMERLDGSTLHDVVTGDGPRAPVEAARVVMDVCRGLAAVHRAGVLHRDLKAHNVMRERDGRVVLTDFSTSGLADDATQLAGTPLYMAPEVLAGGPAYRAAESLADALAALGRRDEGIEVLERVLSRREREAFAGAPLWMHRCAHKLEHFRAAPMLKR